MTRYWQSDPPGELRIPVARPRLPSAEQILPFLRRIDEAQWYSNSGPLVRELEGRLARHSGTGAEVATVSNATIGLALALMAHDLPAGTYCIVPAWTFAATAHAVTLAGLVPWIVDVDRESWALRANHVKALLKEAPGPVSAVIPVSPFGAPLDLAPWQELREATGLAVVVDAAASFDTIPVGAIPAVVSLHATKLLGAGEGGFVVSQDAGIIEEIKKRANFGFWNSREAQTPSLNGKLSEHTAAVGLAALETWPEIREDFQRVAGCYREGLAGQPGISIPAGLGETWVSATMVVATPPGQASQIGDRLAEEKIGTRRWWGGGLHRHAAFAQLPREATPNSDFLADSTIGLPCWRELSGKQVKEVCAAIYRVGR